MSSRSRKKKQACTNLEYTRTYKKIPHIKIGKREIKEWTIRKIIEKNEDTKRQTESK